MHKADYLGGKSFIDEIVYNYRYFIILYFLIIYFVHRVYVDNLVINHDCLRFALVNIVYLIFVIVLHAFGIRQKFNSLTARVIRINIDLIYFVIALFLIGDTQYPTYLIYLFPLISAINYNQNRYYFLCCFFISIYFILLQFSFFFNEQISTNHLIGKTTIFPFFIFVFAAILNVYDRRYAKKEVELKKVVNFIQNVRHSSDYHKALESLIKELEKLTGVPIITIMLYDERKNELFIAESYGISDEQKLMRLKPGTGICGNAFLNNKQIIVNDTTNKKMNHGYHEFRDLPKPVLSELCFPLILRDEESPIGVLNFEAFEKNYFQRELVYMLSSLIHHVKYILDKTLDDHIVRLELIKKTETYSETMLYLRELAHEMRNKLNTFVQFPDYVIDKNGDDQEMIKHLASVQDKECNLLKSSLNKALEARTIYKPKLSNVKMNSIIRMITNNNYYPFRKNDIKFVLEIGYNDILETDAEWLCSILNNLITNSINSYTEKGLSERTINLKVDKHNRNVIFTLSDQAGGLDSALAKKISDPSVLDLQNRRFGLNLVRKYTNLLKGKIECEIIKEPLGTKFTITFPILQKDEN